MKFCFSFKCSEFGKNFKNSSGLFQSHVTTTCQANKTWSLSSIPYECECKCLILNQKEKYLSSGSHCVDPPAPDSAHRLKVMWNALYPPAHGETVMYVCDAGTTFNRFESDFNKWNYTLTCLENNVFSEEPEVAWPTCVDSM